MCFTARVMLILRGGSIHYVNGFKSKSKERMYWWQWGPNTWVNCDGMAIILTLLVHLSHLFQCIAIFSTNYLDYWLRKLTRKLTKLAPKLINGLWPLWRNKKPENKKKNLYYAFCVFLGCPAKPRWTFLKGAADSNFFCWHKQSRNKSHLKLSWPLPRTICLTCKEENASVSVHTFTEAT